MIKQGNKNIFAVYKGTTEIEKIIKGTKVVHNVWKTIDGIPPLDLTKSRSTSLKDYKIYGNSEQRNLPTEYQEVEYIETKGAQYIDTGITCDNNSRINIKFRTPSQLPTNKSTVLFYSGSGIENYGFAMASSGASGKYRAFYRGTHTGSTMLQTSTDYTVDMNKEKFYINNTLQHTFSSVTFTTAYTMPLFAQYYTRKSPQSWALDGTRLYTAKIWDNDVLVRDFIPCYRKQDNVAGLYDLVNKVFYTNDGSGYFEVGNDVTIPTSDRPIKIKSVGDLIEDISDVNYGKYKIPVSVNNVITNIYLDEPLRKVGNYADYIDYENQKRITNVEVLDDTGELPISQSYRGYATSLEETIQLPNISLVIGNNTIDVGTDVKPSNMEIKYKGIKF